MKKQLRLLPIKILLLIFSFIISNKALSQEEFGLITGPPSNEIKTMTINNLDVIFAGTWGEGIIRSLDGATWNKVNTGLTNLFITDIKINSLGALYATTYGGGLFRSTDNGNTWATVNNGIDNLKLKCVLVYSDNTLFVGSYGSGIYRSTNSGTSWTKVNTGLTYRAINCLGRSVAGTIYAGTYGGGLFRSVDNGNTWIAKSGIPNQYINAISTFKDGKDVVCTNGRGLYLSDNEGKSWSEFADPIFSFLGDQNITCFTDIKTNNNTYVVGTRHRGIYTYQTVSNDYYEIGGFRSGVNALVQTSQKLLYLASPNNGIYRSTDKGTSWSFVSSTTTNTFPYSMKLFSDATTPLLFAGRTDGGLLTTADNGNTWTADKFPGKPLSDICVAKNGKAIAKFSSTITEGFWGSIDSGNTWLAFGTQDSARSIGRAVNGDLYVSMIRAFGSPPSVTTTNRIKKSTDNGLTWVELNFNVSPYAPTWIYGMPNGDIFLGTAAISPIFYKSINGGTSFTSTNFSTTLTTRDFEMSPNGNLWMITNNGVYKSTNGGTVWPQVNMNFAAPKTNAVPSGYTATARNDNELYLGMEADGIYRTLDGGSTFDSLNYAINVADVTQSVRNKDGDVFVSIHSLYRNTNPASMGVVSLVKPTDVAYALDLSPSLTWTKADKAELYELQLTRYDDFSYIQYRYVIQDTNVTLFDTLQNNLTYYWRVRGKNFGSYSNWSNVRSFTTKLLPPVLAIPKDSACGVKSISTLRWHPTDGADAYTYEISTSNSFTSIAATGSSMPLDTFVLSGKLEPLTNYFWRVKASNTLGNYSDWSKIGTFKTAVASPKQKIPADKSVKQDIDISFNWETVPEGVDYYIRVGLDSAMTTIISETKAGNITSSTITDLNYNTKIWWQVQSGNQCGLGDWSTAWSFTTGLQAPKKAFPDSARINVPTSVAVRWGSVKNATSYRLQVATDAGFGTIIYDSTGIKITEVDVNNLKDYTNYWWKVKSFLGTNESDFSQPWQFRTWIDTVELTSPLDKAIDQPRNVSLRWTAPNGAATYHLIVANDFNFNSPIKDIDNLTFNQYDFTDLDAGQYWWKVQAKETLAPFRPWSNARSFKIIGSGIELETLKQTIKVLPNPISNNLRIEFELPNPANIDIRILDISGRELAILAKESLLDGQQKIEWNSTLLPSGTYYLQFLVNGEMFTKEIQKVK